MKLRPTSEDDFPVFVGFQQERLARQMVAFVPAAPPDHAKFMEGWSRAAADPQFLSRTIEKDGQVVGYIMLMRQEGDLAVGYWLDRSAWGRGIATAALGEFLQLVEARPLFARTAFDNHGSAKVLRNNGFALIGTDSGPADARGVVIDELVFRLD